MNYFAGNALKQYSMQTLLAVVVASSLGVVGCATSASTGGENKLYPTPTLRISGVVHGGQQPVTGATIQLYTVGTVGIGSASSPLISTSIQTDSGGAFNITGTYSCTSATQVYITAVGGNAGGGTNTAISLVAALGSCSTLLANAATTNIVINEVTTIAAAYALAPYAVDLAHIGGTGANPSGLVSAFANAALLANVSSGAAGGASLGTGVSVPVAELNTLGNILASCVNQSAPNYTASACSTLFAATGSTDTFGAGLAIAKNPGALSITALYTLQSAIAPFQPSLTLSAAPNDFTVSLTSTASSTLSTPYGVALDTAGDAWVVNASGSTVSELAPNGSIVATYSPTGLAGAQGIAIDPSGNVWVANTAGNSVIKLTVSGGTVTATSSFTAGGINGPVAIAIDSGGNVFVANLNGNSVTALTNSGAPIGASPYTAAGGLLTSPAGVALDANHHVFVTSATGSIVEFTSASGVLTQTGILSDSRLQGPSALAVDVTSGRVLTTGYTTGTSVAGAFSIFSSAGAAVSGSPYTSGLASPAGVTTDGTSVWIANSQAAGGLAQYSLATSTLTSPAGGFGILNAPVGVAVDSAGSVWTANSGSNTVSKFIGLAAPSNNVLSVDAMLGSDQNNGSPASPFATISKCVATAQPGQSCQIHSGTYDEMVVPASGGVSLTAYPGESVTISAADPVTNWTSVGNGVYSTPVSVNTNVPQFNGFAQAFPGYQLFYNEVAVPQAQYPAPSANALTPNWATISTATAETTTSNGTTQIIPATITDASAPSIATAGATIHLWSGPDPGPYAGIIQSAPGGSVTYVADNIVSGSTEALPGGLYYVVGAKELITTNTWYYDATNSILYWQPPVGINPNSADVRFKQRYATVNLSGISNVTLSGIHLLGAGVLMDTNSSGNTLDGISASYLSSAQHPHSYGPASDHDAYSFGIQLNGANNTVKNSVIAYSTLSGITLSGGSGNTISNNLLHDLDTFGDDAAAIAIGDIEPNTVAGLAITGNTIYNVGRSAVQIGVNPNTSASGISVVNNNIYGGMYLSADGAAIYTCCHTQLTGTVIQNNWIYDQPLASAITYPATGGGNLPRGAFYADEGVGGFQLVNNNIWNSQTDIFVHGSATSGDPTYPDGNIIISNNTVADASNKCNLFMSVLSSGSSAITISNNKIYTAPILGSGDQSNVSYVASNNSPTGAGAVSFPTPGCSMLGCSVGSQPPAFPSGAPTGGAIASCPS